MPVLRSTPFRITSAVVIVLISLHFILSSRSSFYSIASVLRKPMTVPGPPALSVSSHVSSPQPVDTDPPQRLANATFVILSRNSDLGPVMTSMQQIEDRFNSRHGYPWVILNDEPFTEEFKSRVRLMTDAPVSFGVIPSEQWLQPEWVDEAKAARVRHSMQLQRIPYGGSVSYRNMCRFQSGFFYRHELLQPYKYYWRVEPGVNYYCDLDYDPFVFMQENNKTYGFTVGLYEYKDTVMTLWDTVKDFMQEHPDLVPEDNMMKFISDDGGANYNLCHYWSNFEIADMDFWRGEAYSQFFDFLDRKGGFYYERWGDAPVHSIGASLFLRKEQTHFFEDIGYRHEPFQHCPQGDAWVRGRCSCNPSDNFDKSSYSCLARWEKLWV
ncbi:glycosyltransferase family 15 protein [Heterobasidion irregulare TC 32-1]|uniref:Glycosyltransferase family 15 protein n=1 Tax=Heterobasidion irregulare (strain TC 32-1) TaxID=747525 RepID=W4KKN1_HETIT|nr:glycosyltransferase family 15 protein [Heterobasidion irregulare TC 32-1]ETW85900.1 glycosyltransferase family 15 protein [Heterobasidion irregulare TC 32-1]